VKLAILRSSVVLRVTFLFEKTKVKIYNGPRLDPTPYETNSSMKVLRILH